MRGVAFVGMMKKKIMRECVPVQSSDVLRQSKTSIIVFTSLVCRAAIEGGLSPEEAYSLGDSYIQAAESAKSLDELNPLAMMMYDDFIRRVHKHRTNPNLSRQIQKCVDSAMMKKNGGGRIAQLRNFSFRVTPKSRAMARRSSSVMVCRMMPPPMESTLT